MSPLLPETGDLLVKLASMPLSGLATLGRIVGIETLSLAEILAECIHPRLANDIREMKDSLRKKEMADARKMVAEATVAINRASLHKRNVAMAKAEENIKKEQAAKTKAEADVIRQHAKMRQLEAATNAYIKILEAIGRLRSEGGDVYIDSENLRRILDAGLPPKNDPEDL